MDHRDARRNLNQDRQLFSPPVQRFIDTFGEFRTSAMRQIMTPAE